MENKSKILGQYFTKIETVRKLLKILSEFKSYPNTINILEPSFGTGNFITTLKENGFRNIDGCEIDNELTDNPSDFFDLPLTKKYDLIVGNPPFTKYNLPESYYYQKKHLTNICQPDEYILRSLLKKEKEKIENAFILKSIKHLRNKEASMAFILPISFFIKGKNKLIKEEIIKNFSSVIIFQDRDIWFDYNIPCCFSVFANTDKYKNKIVLIYENGQKSKTIVEISQFFEEMIPETVHYKTTHAIKSHEITLLKFLSKNKINYNKSYKNCNVSAKNILERSVIPKTDDANNYKMAIVRVGNGSVGRCGLINIKKDVLNDMFYVFDFEKTINSNKRLKERLCGEINQRADYFKNITCRVGSKSIKKEDIFNFTIGKSFL